LVGEPAQLQPGGEFVAGIAIVNVEEFVIAKAVLVELM